MDLNYELYKVFHCVAKHLSFTKAAEELFLSQSAISQSIKQLEEKLQNKLFYRSTKTVRLTSEGQIMFEYVDSAVNSLTAGERALRERNQLVSGEILLASTDTICKYFLLSKIKQFNKMYKNIKFNIINSTSPRCLELLESGSVDIAVVNLPKQLPAAFQIEQRVQVKDAFIASADIINFQGRTFTLQELSNYPLIVLDKNTVTRQFFDSIFAQQGINITPEIELSSIDLLVEMAKAGLGIGFAPSYCTVNTPEITLLNVRHKIPSRSLAAVTLKKLPKSQLITRFLDILDLDGTNKTA